LLSPNADKAHLLQAHHASWTTYFSLPELRSCRDHAEQGIALYKLEEHRSHAFTFGGHDPGVCCRNHAAMTMWLLGYADQALEKAHDALRLAEELAHPHSLVQTLSYSTYLHQLRHDPDLVQERAEAVIALCTEQGIAPHYLAGATILRGWAMAVERRADEGIAQMHKGLVALQAKGAGLRRSYYLALLGEAYGQTGAADQGLQVLAKALDLVEKGEERTWEAEVYRLKGTLLLSSSVSKPIEAEVSFNKAIEVARRQSARSWELRAATQLARLWRSQGKTDQARDLLAPIYGWFTEGFDTPDLKDAKALLDELA
jgi:predicted ATPase